MLNAAKVMILVFVVKTQGNTRRENMHCATRFPGRFPEAAVCHPAEWHDSKRGCTEPETNGKFHRGCTRANFIRAVHRS